MVPRRTSPTGPGHEKVPAPPLPAHGLPDIPSHANPKGRGAILIYPHTPRAGWGALESRPLALPPRAHCARCASPPLHALTFTLAMVLPKVSTDPTSLASSDQSPCFPASVQTAFSRLLLESLAQVESATHHGNRSRCTSHYSLELPHLPGRSGIQHWWIPKGGTETRSLLTSLWSAPAQEPMDLNDSELASDVGESSLGTHFRHHRRNGNGGP